MMKQLLWTVAILATVVIVSGCGGALSGSEEGGGGGGEESYIFLPKSLDNEYWVDAQKGMEDEAKKLGVKAQFLGPQRADAGEQVAIFENAIARNPAGIAVSANDPETVKGAISQATEAGIPVIAWDSEVPESQVATYIGTNNVEAGKQAAEALAKAMGEKGRVAVLTGSLTALNAQQRIQGLKEGLKAYPGIEIVSTEVTGESVEGSTAKTENLLQADPNIDAFFGVTGSDAPGIGGAVKQAGKCEEIKVAGFDVVPQGIELMKANCIQGLIAQRPYGMTVQALDLLQKLHNGEKPPAKPIDTGVVTVTPDSLEKFLAEAPH